MVRPMRFLPIFLDVRGRRALVLGTGEAALRKADALTRAGAVVTIAPVFDPALLRGCAIAIGADAPACCMAELSAVAQAAGIPVNVVDQPALCSFITPSVIDRDPLVVAVGTGGAAPVLARLVRARIEALLPPAWGRLAALADSLKEEIRAALPDVAQRRRVLERVLTGPVAAQVFAGNDDGARVAFRAALTGTEKAPGFVYLVDPGPGPPDLLTLRAHRVMGEADVIVHDADISPALLDMARRDAEREVATTPARLVELAQAGRLVVRLGPAPGDAPALANAGVGSERVSAQPLGPYSTSAIADR